MEFKALSELATIIMGQSPKKEEVNKKGKGTPLLNGPTEFGSYCPTPVQFTESPKKIAPKGSLLFCVRGSTTGKMNWADQDYAIGRGLAAIIPKDKNMKMYIRSSIEKNLESILGSATGSTFPNVSSNLLNSFLISLSKGSIKSSLFLEMISNKILVNEEIIRSLEQLLQTLFKRWFIDFEFPNEDGEPYKSSGGEMIASELGEIPINWKISFIGNVAKLKSGYAFKSAWWLEKGTSVIKIKDIRNNTINFSDLSNVSEEKGKLAKQFEVKAGDIVIALTGATLGKIALIPKTNDKLLVNQRVGKFFIGEKPLQNIAYIYCLLSTEKIMSKIIDRGSGSAQANLSPSNLESIKIVLPSQSIISSFNTKMEYLFELITNLHYENSKLTDLRDTLLPKFLSGEIEISNEIEVTEHVPIP